jgi:prolipoprotein diacylglyceryltransferase
MLFIVAGGLVGAAVFARYGLVFRYLQDASEPTLSGFIRFGGRTLLGGLAGGYAGVVVTKRFIGYRRPTGDILAPGVALGMAIGRLGCFLGERPGTVTSLPWGVRVPPNAAPLIPRCPACESHASMHPSFLYESLFLLVASRALLVVVRRRRLPLPWMVEGDAFKAFLLTYAVFRFFVEFVRGNPVMAFDLSGSQLIVLPSSIVLALYFVRRRLSWGGAPLATVAT